MLSFEEARARVLSGASPVAPERVDLEASVGRVLHGDLTAPSPLPPFDYSAMDGYAVRSEDLSRDGGSLTVEGESRTGGDLPDSVRPGTACRIFTGARLPPGADAVVMQEQVTREGPLARFSRAPKPGEHVRRTGEDLARGALVLAHGTRLGPFHLGLLASVEATRVTVARRPVVSILSTGDELRDPGTPDRPGSVVDSNGPGLAALVRACGGLPRLVPHARDDRDATRDALRRALEGADLVLTVGGVSVGEHDHVRDAMEALGITLDFWRVAIRPGKPLALGRAPTGATVLGLPGNPASAMLTFVLFGAPFLRALQGDRAPVAPTVRAVLEVGVRHTPGRTEFLRARLDPTGERATVRALSQQSSGAVMSFAWADALVVVPSEVGELPAGTSVECMRLGDV